MKDLLGGYEQRWWMNGRRGGDQRLSRPTALILYLRGTPEVCSVVVIVHLSSPLFTLCHACGVLVTYKGLKGSIPDVFNVAVCSLLLSISRSVKDYHS